MPLSSDLCRDHGPNDGRISGRVDVRQGHLRRSAEAERLGRLRVGRQAVLQAAAEAAGQCILVVIDELEPSIKRLLARMMMKAHLRRSLTNG